MEVVIILRLENLDEKTRKLMLEELELDIKNNTLYISPRLTEFCKGKYAKLLREAMTSGNDMTLARSLRKSGCLKPYETRRMRNGSYRQVKVPKNAAETLAEGEFNRFYICALCRRVIDEGRGYLEVYRAKQVSNPRPESERKIGKKVDPHKLLHDLRTSPGVEPALGIPPGPNSGLSVRIKFND